jgi:hypothetical protein
LTYPPSPGWNPNDQPIGDCPPSGAYPPPGGYPPPAPYPPPGMYPPPNRTNGMALASLICSIAGLATCALSSIVGLILGVIALGQIKKTGEEGRGMALAGVIVGGVVTALMVVGIILYVVFIVWAVSESSYDYSSY